MLKKWNVSKGDKKLSAIISERHGVPKFAAHLLLTRGLTEAQELEDFLTKDAPLCDPFEFIDMEKAVVRIRKAIENGERIAVFGDYDADGVTATALLYSYLESCEANVLYMLPDRATDGYGLRMSTVDTLEQYGTQLIITVDNGISCYEEVEYAKSKGIDVVITDHHQPPDRLPDACAVVDPHRHDCGGAFKDFAGVGVAFKLVCALEGDDEFILDNYSDLVAIGTIADVVPLIGENRRLVMHGLESIQECNRPGIFALANKAGLGLRKYKTSDISFILAPRINAAGRVGKPDRAVRLMLSEDMDECSDLAEDLCEDNSRRLELEREMTADAWNYFDEHPEVLLNQVVIIVGNGWNKGVIGIFASRMCETLGKPCFVLSIENGVATGSGRSVEGFSLHSALCACSDLLVHFGGHAMAAGLTINEEDIEDFTNRINEYASSLDEMPVPVIEIDCVLPANMVDYSLYRDSCFLEPFGVKNPAPVIGMTELTITDIRSVGNNQHQRLTLEKNGCVFNAMCFKTLPENFNFNVGDIIDCVVSLDFNESYARQAGDNAALTRIIKDIRLSGIDVDKMNHEQRLFEKAMRGEALTQQEKQLIIPNRQQSGAVYLHVKDGYRGGLENLGARLFKQGIGYGAVLVSLEAMRDRGLIKMRQRANCHTISPVPVSEKVDLNESYIIKKLSED